MACAAAGRSPGMACFTNRPSPWPRWTPRAAVTLSMARMAPGSWADYRCAAGWSWPLGSLRRLHADSADEATCPLMIHFGARIGRCSPLSSEQVCRAHDGTRRPCKPKKKSLLSAKAERDLASWPKADAGSTPTERVPKGRPSTPPREP